MGAGEKNTSDLHHLELVLTRPAIGAAPVLRHILPGRTRGDALAGQALFLVVHVSANHAHITFHYHLLWAGPSDGTFSHFPSAGEMRTGGGEDGRPCFSIRVMRGA